LANYVEGGRCSILSLPAIFPLHVINPFDHGHWALLVSFRLLIRRYELLILAIITYRKNDSPFSMVFYLTE